MGREGQPLGPHRGANNGRVRASGKRIVLLDNNTRDGRPNLRVRSSRRPRVGSSAVSRLSVGISNTVTPLALRVDPSSRHSCRVRLGGRECQGGTLELMSSIHTGRRARLLTNKGNLT